MSSSIPSTWDPKSEVIVNIFKKLDRTNSLLERLIPVAPKPLEKEFERITIPLDTARDNVEWQPPVYGDFILVEDITGTLDVRLKSKGFQVGDIIELDKVKIVRTEFDSLYLTNAAQPGLHAVLYIGRAAAFTSEATYMGDVVIIPPERITNFGGVAPTPPAAAVPITAVHTPVSAVIVQAFSVNGALVYVGGMGVTVGTGVELTAGQGVAIDIDNAAKVYVIGSAVGQGWCAIGVGW